MRRFQILINDRNYSSWSIIDPDTNKNIDIYDLKYPGLSNLNPIELKLFSRDIFTIDDNNNVNIVYSPLKNSNEIAGVLLLENNKTFGRTINRKRLLYKCVPDDKHIPAFLIPYEVQMGFSKVIKYKYVIFEFENWRDKRPHGILVQTLGNTDNLEVFYEYQLYFRSLQIIITTFINKTH